MKTIRNLNSLLLIFTLSFSCNRIENNKKATNSELTLESCIADYINRNNRMIIFGEDTVFYSFSVVFFEKDKEHYFMTLSPLIYVPALDSQYICKYATILNKDVAFLYKEPVMFDFLNSCFLLQNAPQKPPKTPKIYDGSWYPETYKYEGNFLNIEKMDTIFEEALGKDFIDFEKLHLDKKKQK